MASAQSIPAFPADINRDAFGHWLSGFVDGEGCFRLLVIRNKRVDKVHEIPTARFELGLRADDHAVLELIRSYFGVGYIYAMSRANSTTNSKPASSYRVTSTADMHDVLVPHFSRCPLHAKKRGDFEIWKRGVEIIHRVNIRPRRGKPAGSGNGTLTKWEDAEREEVIRLANSLKAGRVFVMPAAISGLVFAANESTTAHSSPLSLPE